MSYDLYCYKSEIGTPDLEEARQVVESEETPDGNDRERMRRVADALVIYDQRLEIFGFDYAAIAERASSSISEAQESIDYVEVNSPEDDENFVQFCISRNVVSISFAFGVPEEFIDRIMKYVEVISKETGYFLYDPQDESVSDPLHPIPLTPGESQRWSDNADVGFVKQSTPWWKFW